MNYVSELNSRLSEIPDVSDNWATVYERVWG